MTGGHAPGSAVVAVTITFTCLATVAALARLVTRIFIVRKEGLDDILISFAVVWSSMLSSCLNLANKLLQALTIALTTTMCMQVNYGVGRHIESLSDHDIVMSTKWFWASVWIYYLALCFVKISILLQYLRVFPSKGFRRACYILMGIIICYSLGTFFSSIFSCVPIARFWDQSIEGTCVNRAAVWYVCVFDQ